MKDSKNKDKPETPKIQVTLTKAQYEWLKGRVGKEGHSISEVARLCIYEAMKRDSTKPDTKPKSKE